MNEAPVTPRDAPRSRRKLVPLLLIGLGIAVFSFVENETPRAQTIHFIIGDAASRTRELRVRYAEEHPGAHEEREDWTREATFRYAEGGAPRIMTHEPHLKNGSYVVEIEILTADANNAGATRQSITRHVKFGGGTTSIELAHELAGAAK